MDTNQQQNKNWQINTFADGMNSDSSDSIIANNQYRYAQNLRVVTDSNSNSGELHLIEGTHRKKLVCVDKNGNNISISGNVLSFDQINGIGVLIVRDKITGEWSIYKFDIRSMMESKKSDSEWKFGQNFSIMLSAPPEDIIVCNLIAGPFNEAIWNTEDIDENGDFTCKPICTIVRMEAEELIKIYIADGIHEVMSVQIQGDTIVDDFEELFAYQEALLPQPTVQWGEYSADKEEGGASLNGIKFQYAYRIFPAHGTQSFWSPISNTLTAYKDSVSGFETLEVDGKLQTNSNRMINIILPEANIGSGYQVDVYRVAYVMNGGQPIITRVYRGDYIDNYSIIDYGGGEEDEMTLDEFAANVNSAVIPKEIEVKGDYMFFGNVSYVEDMKNLQFQDFDARCYSAGNYYIDENNQKISNLYNLSFEEMLNIPISTLGHEEFTYNKVPWEYDNWKALDSGGYNGIGPCFKWKYNTKISTLSAHYGESPENAADNRTYRAEDVYRFGVILYDKHGRASSVKWIADIKMPPHAYSGDIETIHNYLTSLGSTRPADILYPIRCVDATDVMIDASKTKWEIKNLGITFVPINTDKDIWKDIEAYQIVQCPRTVSDKHILFQGICGYPLKANTEYPFLEHPGFITTNDQEFVLPAPQVGEGSFFAGDDLLNYWSGDEGRAILHMASSYRDAMLFVCPEFCFCPDDVKAVISERIQNLKLQKDVIYNSLQGYWYGQRGYIRENVIAFGRPDVFLPQSGTTQEISKAMINAPHHYVYISPIISTTSDEAWTAMKFTPIYKGYRSGNTNPTIASGDSVTWNGINGQTLTLKNCYLFDTTTIDLSTRFDPQWENLNWKFHLVPADSRREDYFTLFASYIDADDPEYNAIIGPYSGRGYYSIAANCIADTIRSVSYDSDTKNLRGITYIQQPGINDFDQDYNNKNFLEFFGDKNQYGYTNFHAPAHFTLCSGGAENSTRAEIHKHTIAADEYTNGYHREHKIFKMTDGPEIYDEGTKIYGRSLRPLSNAGDWGTVAASLFPIASGGSAILLSLDQDEPDSFTDVNDSIYGGAGLPNIDIRNIIDPTAVPYGGYREDAISNSKYIATPAYSKKIGNRFPSVDCFYGDCYTKPFIYYATHFVPRASNTNPSLPTYVGHTKEIITYIVPLESEIDIHGQLSNYYGPTEKATKTLKTQDWAGTMAGETVGQEQNVYMYNKAYSITPDLPTYYSTTKYDIFEPWPTRIHYTDAKSDRETIDSWRPSANINYIDLDSRYGQITAIKSYKDKLMFWQEHGSGIVQVNERTILQDNESRSIMLGTGEVFGRYDYISTTYGMKQDQRAIGESDYNLYWWDGYRREILSYTEGYQCTPLSTVKNIKSYLRQRDETAIPAVLYDHKNKEVVFNVVNGIDDSDESVVYNEYTNKFTSVYKFSPTFYSRIGDYIFTAPKNINSNTIYRYNQRQGNAYLFENEATPRVDFVVNNLSYMNKVYDTQTFAGRLYDGHSIDMSPLTFAYTTPLGQYSEANGKDIVTDREQDYKLDIPRALEDGLVPQYGNRMRGKTMQCRLESNSNNLDFSLQYITTKYRISWT